MWKKTYGIMLKLKAESLCCNQNYFGVSLAAFFFSGSFAFSFLKYWGSEVCLQFSCYFYLPSQLQIAPSPFLVYLAYCPNNGWGQGCFETHPYYSCYFVYTSIRITFWEQLSIPQYLPVKCRIRCLVHTSNKCLSNTR